MLPISPRAERPTSLSASTPRRLQSVSASSGGNRSSTIASRSPKTGSTAAGAGALLDREGQPLVGPAHDRRGRGARGLAMTECVGQIDDRQYAGAKDEHAATRDGTDGIVLEPERPLDTVELHSKRQPARLD